MNMHTRTASLLNSNSSVNLEVVDFYRKILLHLNLFTTNN